MSLAKANRPSTTTSPSSSVDRVEVHSGSSLGEPTCSEVDEAVAAALAPDHNRPLQMGVDLRIPVHTSLRVLLAPIGPDGALGGPSSRDRRATTATAARFTSAVPPPTVSILRP